MTTKQEYQEALNRMEEAYYSSDNSMGEMSRFKEDINLLTGLVNEHFKENVETNFEYYKDEILECCIDHLAVVKGIPKPCSKTDCNDCDFLTIQKDCHEIAKDWLKQPCKKPTYKLSQFEYDLLNAYKNSGMRQCIPNYSTLLEMYGKGYFKGIDDNETIGDILANCEVVG